MRDGLRGRGDLVIVTLLSCGLGAVYIALQRGSLVTYDADIMVQVTRSIVEQGSIEVSNDPYLFNSPYPSYGLGISLLLIPFYLVQRWLHPDGAGWLLLANVVLVAATGAVLYRIAIALRWRRIDGVLMALFFGLLTMAPQQTTDLFSEPAVGLCLVVAVLGCVQWRNGRARGPWYVGLGVGLAVVFRFDSIVLGGVVLLTVPLFVPWQRLRSDPSALVGVGGPVVAALAWQAVYNNLRYGSPLDFGYAATTWSTPFLTGLYGNLLSPGKGLFVYAPILLLAVPGFVLLWRTDRALCVAIGALCAVRPLFYARWQSWMGGVAWGPRFMFPLCALLTVPAVATLRALRRQPAPARRLGYAVTGLLVAASLAVAALSVLVPFEQWFGESHIAREGESAEVVATRAHDYLWSIGGSHVVGNIRRLDEASPFPLQWFDRARTPWGLAFAGVGALLLIGASALASASRKRAVTVTDLVPRGVDLDVAPLAAALPEPTR